MPPIPPIPPIEWDEEAWEALRADLDEMRERIREEVISGIDREAIVREATRGAAEARAEAARAAREAALESEEVRRAMRHAERALERARAEVERHRPQIEAAREKARRERCHAQELEREIDGIVERALADAFGDDII